MDEKQLRALITEKIRPILAPALMKTEAVLPIKTAVDAAKKVIKEAVVLIPKTFVLKTEFLSGTTKELHMKLYKSYVDTYNLISAKLDSLSPDTASNPNSSEYRHLKIDEQHNLNGVKLHELYFTNISDVHSEIRLDSIPYMRLARDWGTFDRWQFDFRACGMAATEGWAVCYYDPYKQKYFNCFVEKHCCHIPVCGIPVVVVDTWHHAWFRDHAEDKQGYLDSMMRELNWDVIEARMVVTERSDLHNLYAIQPLMSTKPETILAALPAEPPISKDQVVADKEPKVV